MRKFLSKFFPSPIRNKYKQMIRYGDVEMDHEKFIGGVMILGVIVSAILSFGIYTLMDYTLRTTAIIFVGLFLVIQVVGYAWVAFRADAKSRFIEDILPDALLLMSMNIRSGMTTDRALIISARPEFGPLERELARAGKQMLGGKDVAQALLGITDRVKSGMVDRTIRLIIEGIESGGELSSLLQQTAEDIQNTKLIQNEVRSNLLMYAIFIFFAVGIGAPLLFAISTHLVGSVGSQFAALQIPGMTDKAPTVPITADFLVKFALVSLTVTSIFGGMIVGIVKNGSEKAGFKIIPLLLLISIGVFFVVRLFVGSAFPAIG